MIKKCYLKLGVRMEMNKKYKINRLNLWILIGICWLLPQVFIKYLPEELQIIKPVILIILGFFIMFDKSVNKLFLEKDNENEK